MSPQVQFCVSFRAHAKTETVYVQLFGPSVFGEHALRLNSFAYDNTVNMDNVAKGDGVTRVVNGLAYVPASRHPYEYPLNDAYQSFLASGLHERAQRWGRDLTIDDVAEPAAWTGGDFPTHWILDRLARFYDVQHEALSRTRLLQSIPHQELAQYSTYMPATPSFRVFLFTKNRLKSFVRCWESVRTAFPIRAPVSVEIRVDMDPYMSSHDEDEYLDYIESMQDDLGPAVSLDVVFAKHPLGLRESILSSWDPDTNHEFAIFLVCPRSRPVFRQLRVSDFIDVEGTLRRTTSKCHHTFSATPNIWCRLMSTATTPIIA